MSRRTVLLIGLLLLLGLGAHLLHYALLPVEFLVSENMQRVPDDAFYYLETAHNLAQRGVAAFDGATVTNGFQPLHFVCCTLLARYFDSSNALLHAVLVWQALAAVLFGLIWLLSVQREFSPALVLAPLFLLFFDDIQQVFINGLEPYLGFVLLALLLALYLKPAEPFDSLGRSAMIGVISGLLLLARVDFMFLVGPLYLAFLTRARRDRATLLRILSSGVLGMVIVAPYLYWNISTFGHLMPISGAIKGGFSLANWRKDMPLHPFFFSVVLLALLRLALWALTPLAERRRWLVSAALLLYFAVFALCCVLLLWLALPPDRLALLPATLLLVLLLILGLLSPSSPSKPVAQNVATLAWAASAFVVLHFCYELFFIARFFAFWHCVAYLAAFAVLALDLGRRVPALHLEPPLVLPRSWAALAIALLLSVGAMIALLENRAYAARQAGLADGSVCTWQSSAHAAALWSRDNLPAGSLAAARDAGIFGFFSGLDTLNLDGVIMDFAFKQAIDSGRLHQELARRNVDFLMLKSVAVAELEDEYRFSVPDLGLELDAQHERYHSPVFDEGSGPVRLGIWYVGDAW